MLNWQPDSRKAGLLLLKGSDWKSAKREFCSPVFNKEIDMEKYMQKDLIEKNLPTIMSLQLRLGFLKLEFQVTKSDISREGYTSSQLLEYCILCFIFLLSILLRASLYKEQNGDYIGGFHQWYDYIKMHGGFAAFKDNFADYNPPYLYLLAWATYIPIDPLVAIKAIPVFFDLVIALFTSLILRLKYPRSSVPILGAVVMLFAPTVFIDSAAWGQCDAVYTAWCLGSLYFLLRNHPAWACVFFGMALSFKLQAVFFLPVLIVLLLTRRLPIKCLIFIPVIFLAFLTPALLAGRDAWSLLTVYLGQANEYSTFLTLKAPTFYQWVPAKDPENWIRMGMILATMMVALISYLTMRSRKPITPDLILKLTLIFAVAIPFFLPEMHERYFYLADVVSIIYAFCFPRYFYVAVIEQLCSSMSCIPSLFGEDPTINLVYVAFAVLFLIVVTLVDLVKTLYPNILNL
jgi:Gpi18-like mannosyltransferase